MSNNIVIPPRPEVAPLTSVEAVRVEDGKNVVPAELPSLFTDSHQEPLRELYSRVVEKASSVEAWYRRQKEGKRKGAFTLRILAVLLTAAATMTPIVRELWPAGPEGWKPVPFSALFAALAATCIALDKLLGLSSGWMRYFNAMMELQAKIDAFKFAWSQAALEERYEARPPRESLARSLALMSGLLNDVREVLRAESQAWAAEFKSALVELDKAAEAQRAAAAALPTTGSLRVKVTNAEALDGKAYKVRLNDGPSHEGTGALLALTGLQPGQVRVRVSGLKGQAAVSAEDIVHLKPGEIATVELELG